MRYKYLLVTGYGFSGSSAVIDFLSEFEHMHNPGFAIRIIKDRYGLLDLEQSICDNWDATVVHACIRDFEKLAAMWGADRTPFHPIAFRHNNVIGDNYRKAVRDFIEEITTFRYLSHDYMTDSKRNIFLQYWNLFSRSRIGKLFHMREIGTLVSYSDVNREHFLTAARKMLDTIYLVDKHVEDTIILDHSLPAHKIHRTNDYFGDNVGVVVVDRDPRDVFCSWVRHKSEIGFELRHKMDVEKFCRWYEDKHRNRITGSNIIYVSFEKFVKTSEEMTKLMRFCELTEEKHRKKSAFFDKNVSSNNIGVWESFDKAPPEVFEYISEYFQLD